jgi:N-acetyl sugar amidotransferase
MKKNKLILPKKVIFCKICVQSNQRPRTTVEFKKKDISIKSLSFNKDDICDACRYHYEIKENINWKDREKKLKDLCNKHKSFKNNYDVLVPGSGGKDSIYVAHYLKKKYNMRVLICTWSPHMYTPEGIKNMQEWQKMGFDHIQVTPNYEIHSKLTRLAFKKLVNPFQPFIMGQKNMAPKIASKYNIKLIMYGENNGEVHNDIEMAKQPKMNEDFYSSKNPNKNLYFSGLNSQQLSKHKIFDEDLEIYKPISRELLNKNKIEVHFFSYYKKWSPHENYYYVMKNCKFTTNQDGRSEGTYTKFSSLDDKLDGQHYFTTFIKFGIGRATADCCRDIRDGFLSRDEAIKLVKKYDGEFPKKYFLDFLDYIKMTQTEYWDIIDKVRPKHLWRKVGNKWELKNKVY